MIKENKKINIFFAIAAAAIIIIATFTVVTQYQVSDLTATAKEKEALPLLVSISADKTTGIIPLEVSFTPIVSNAVGTVKYQWDFGDGNTSEEMKPTYLYRKNGTFMCNLTVTDETNRETSGSVKVTPLENSPPTVSIEANDRPRRPKNFLLEFLLGSKILEQAFRMDTWGGGDYRWARDLGLLNILFKDQESFMPVEAIASDPDGDEIVSYNWTLKPPGYTARLGKEPKEPKYYYSGKKVDIPAMDIYPVGGYSLICTVTDSAGKIRSEKFDFSVMKSNEKQQREERQKTTQFQINNWINKGKDSRFLGPFVAGVLTLLIVNLTSTKIFPLPLVKLGMIILIDIILQTRPEYYTDYENLMEPLKDLTDGRTLAYSLLNKFTNKLQGYPDIATGFANFFGAKNIEDFREYLGFDNKRPMLSDLFPGDNSINVPIDCPQVSITVEDPEGDPFNVAISGTYVNDVAYTGQYNGTFTASLINPLPETEEITWTVEVTDQNGKIITGSYKFKTLY